MATRRKAFTPEAKFRSTAAVFNEFIKALLAGTIRASKLIVSRDGKRTILSYDDPNG